MFTYCSYCRAWALCTVLVTKSSVRRCCAVCFESRQDERVPTNDSDSGHRIASHIKEDDQPWGDLATRHYEDRFDGLEGV